MRYSDNYNLKLPQRGVDRANVDDLDDNFTIIDGALADDRQISLLMYDSTSTYNTGDIVGYENPTTHRIRAYRCLEDNVTGPWDATKWAQTTLAAEIEAGGGGGGSSTLAGLSDVDLGTPADGEVLAYDATEGKWVNAEGGSGGASELSDLDDVSLTTPTEGQILTYDGDEWVNTDAPDVDVTKTATGNPIEFEDGASAPLVKCVSAITGSQDLHGYDKPWVGGAGKNKLPITVDNIKFANGGASTWNGNQKTISGVTFQIITDDGGNVLGVHVSGTNTGSATIVLYLHETSEFVLPAGTYIYSSGVTSVSGNIRLRFNDGNFFAVTTSEVTRTMTESHEVMSSIVIEPNDTTTGILFAPMIRLSTATDPTFTPYSNICPITAYTEGKIEVIGKNLFDKNDPDILTGRALDSSTGNVYIAANWSVSDYIGIEPSTKYTLSAMPTSQSSVAFYDSNKTFISGFSSFGTRETPSNAKYVRFDYKTEYADIMQLEKGETSTAYEPYKGTTHETTYPTSIYRGSEDVVKGEVDADKIKLTIASDIQLYGPFGTDNALLFYYDPSVNIGTYSRSTHPEDNKLISNFYNAITTENENDMHDFEIRTNNNAQMVSNRIYIRDSRFETALAFNQYIANNPIEVVVKLATPTTSSVTPTNLPIKSLSGYSHIESSTGDMEIEYITGKYQPIVDLISESSGGGGGDNQHHYSTEEQVVGTWIDGKTLYEKTFTHQLNGSGYNIDISTMGIDKCWVYDGYYDIGDTQLGLNEFMGSTYTQCHTSPGSPYEFIYCYNSYASNSTVYVTIRYTKASQSRSAENLSKGGEVVDKVDKSLEEKKEESSEPISEPLETKTDSLSKDEEKAEIEDENKEIEEITEEPEEPEATEEEPTEEPVDPEPSKEEDSDER